MSNLLPARHSSSFRVPSGGVGSARRLPFGPRTGRQMTRVFAPMQHALRSGCLLHHRASASRLSSFPGLGRKVCQYSILYIHFTHYCGAGMRLGWAGAHESSLGRTTSWVFIAILCSQCVCRKQDSIGVHDFALIHRQSYLSNLFLDNSGCH